MTHSEALELIRPVVAGQIWADLGAGAGTFTRALAELIGEGGTVYAVDKDVRGLRQNFAGARVEVIRADFTQIELPPLDGILLANALHYVRGQQAFLQRLWQYLHPGGRLAILEYENRKPNPWVPYPIRFAKLADVLRESGFAGVEKIATRASRFGGEMYLALAKRGRELRVEG